MRITARSLLDISAAFARDRRQEPAGQDRSRLVDGDIDVLRGVAIGPFEQQPLPRPAGVYERPPSFELLAVQGERQSSFLVRGGEVLVVLELVGADVPDHHGPPAVLALRDRALESRV